MQVLKQRKRDVYINDTCKICFQECETQDHLAKCTKLQLTWSKLEEEGCSAIVNKAGKEKANLKTYNKQKIAELVFGKSLDEKISTRKELIKGIVTKQRVQKISSLLEEEVAKTSKILHAFIDSFSHHFCKLIWNPRCEKIIEWEKKEGITKEKKTENARKRKSEETKEQDKENRAPASGTKEKDIRKTKVSRKEEKLDIVKKRDSLTREWVSWETKPAWSSLVKPKWSF